VHSTSPSPTQTRVKEHHHRIVAQLEDRFPNAGALLEEASPDILAFTGFARSTGAAQIEQLARAA
jgi:hypothetical protein